MQRNEIQTEWIVFTGAPCSGKTTILEALNEKGYKVVYESAREFLAEGISAGASIDEMRASEENFQLEVLKRKRDVEDSLEVRSKVLLDRALPDSYGYYMYLGMNTDRVLELCYKYKYNKVFYFELLPMIEDGFRVESGEESRLIGEHLYRAYKTIGYEVIRVPVFSNLKENSIQDRLEFIENML